MRELTIQQERELERITKLNYELVYKPRLILFGLVRNPKKARLDKWTSQKATEIGMRDVYSYFVFGDGGVLRFNRFNGEYSLSSGSNNAREEIKLLLKLR